MTNTKAYLLLEEIATFEVMLGRKLQVMLGRKLQVMLGRKLHWTKPS